MHNTNPIEKHPRRWLFAGTVALALAGLYALVLVIARTPQLKANPIFAKLFHEALVVHVDLSVMVWFFAIAAFCMVRYTRPQGSLLALVLTYAGMALMVLSPLDGAAVPLMSNYIPVITSPIFFAGLACVFSAMALLSVATLLTKRPMFEDYEGWAARGMALIFLMALVAHGVSMRHMPEVLEGEQYFDTLFWAGGHIWQFAFSASMMLAWIVLFKAIAPEAQLNPARLTSLFLLNNILAGIGLYGVAVYMPASMEHRNFFTTHMALCGALAPALLGIYLFLVRLKALPRKTCLNASLTMSWVLFACGGGIALTITGQDARIPAHYHGSIVAITIAVMGLAYAYMRVERTMARVAPIVYGVGQIMHITGLAYSGGYGALRKTPGADSLPPDAVAALGLMGLGGLLAIVGGILFVVVMAQAFRKKD